MSFEPTSRRAHSSGEPRARAYSLSWSARGWKRARRLVGSELLRAAVLRLLVRHPQRIRHALGEVLSGAAVPRAPLDGAADDVGVPVTVRRVRSVLATVVAEERRAPRRLFIPAPSRALRQEVEGVDPVLQVRRVRLQVRPEQLSEPAPRNGIDLHQPDRADARAG